MDTGPFYGLAQFSEQRIYIDTDLCTSRERVEETFLHELLHVALYNTGIDKLIGKNEETLVQGVGQALYGIMKDNGML